MTTLKNKILIKVNRKLIFIISILMIVALNLFGEVDEGIGFRYYDYTNKLYHSTLKTEIIPSEYIFITTYSNNNIDYNSKYKYANLYLYNLKTKEKKLFNAYKTKINTNEHTYEVRTPAGYYYDTKTVTNYEYLYLDEYYDIKGNLTTNWTDTNMEENELYEITNNRFGETFYNEIYTSISINLTKENEYIQKAYKYSLTQPEIINKKDRGIYLFKFKQQYYSDSEIFYTLCFQNEYYKKSYSDYFEENGLLNYNSNGRVIVHEYRPYMMMYSYSTYDSWRKQWITYTNVHNYGLTNTIYFQLNNKSLIKPTWNEFTNDYLNYRKLEQKEDKVFYTKENIEKNLHSYNVIADVEYLGFIPIEEFEYYLLAD